MKPKVYIETTVVSYYAGQATREVVSRIFRTFL